MLKEIPQPINFSMTLNGNIVQQGISTDMIHGFDEIIANISQYFTLQIGDVVFTGTPAGVGECTITDVLRGYIEDEKLFEVEIK